jgi:RNA polymerase sigma-70 factor, ECF subfamily
MAGAPRFIPSAPVIIERLDAFDGHRPQRRSLVPLALVRPDPPAEAVTPAESAEAMLERIFRQHGQLVLDTAYRLTGRISDAEDVLQDVFLALPGALERYEDRDTFLPWLRRVTVRMSLMHLRRCRNRREIAIESVPEPSTPASEASIERDALQRAIAALPDGLRAVFVMREVEGYSHAEIANLLDIREGTSQVTHHRAVRLLRAALGDQR